MMDSVEMERQTDAREAKFGRRIKKGLYLPSFMFRGDEVCFFMWELAGDTHEEAMANLNMFEWTPEQSRLFLLIVSLDITPTNRTWLFGTNNPNPFVWYEGKIDAFRCAFVGGKTWERLESERED